MFQNYFNVLIILSVIRSLGPTGLLASRRRSCVPFLRFYCIQFHVKNHCLPFSGVCYVCLCVTCNFLGHFTGCWHAKPTEHLTTIVAFCKHEEINAAIRSQHLPWLTSSATRLTLSIYPVTSPATRLNPPAMRLNPPATRLALNIYPESLQPWDSLSTFTLSHFSSHDTRSQHLL